jgi:multidrug efflux system membrane fusion protein
MIASVALGGPSAKASPIPLLPLTAFVSSPAGGDRFAVMVAEGTGSQARAKLREVELGPVVGNRVAVTKGLVAGERVITTGASLLADGETVEVLPMEEP